MKIIVNIGTIIERADGTRSETFERYLYTEGDNPRFEDECHINAINNSAIAMIGKIGENE